MAVVRTSLGLCGQCEDPLMEGKCRCATDMTVCDGCGRGPLNDGERFCGCPESDRFLIEELLRMYAEHPCCGDLDLEELARRRLS